MGERYLREIKITFWKKPQLDGYTITVPEDATDEEITEKVGEFMESELMDTWDWEKGECQKEYTIDISPNRKEP